jgi:nucleoid DNA-binding protein
MRVAYGYRTASTEAYKDFCEKNPEIKLTCDEFKSIIYEFNFMFRDHILETGEKIKMPNGVGEFSIHKKKKKRVKTINGQSFVNLSIDWQKTREKGKRIYNFNFHTEGYFFKWKWFKSTATFKYSDLFYFRPSRVNSRLLSHYLKVDEKYQHTYATWTFT